MKVDRVIKLGGSSITKKDQLETLKDEQLDIATKLIKACVDKQLTCVIVHGAGSFGHFQAKEFSVVGGYKTLPDNDLSQATRGFVLTRQSVTKLNKLVVDSLISKSVPAVALSPFPSWKTHDGVVQRDGVEVMAELLKEGFVPVIHGDCCLDSHRGWTILSGDTVIETVCDRLEVNTVVFLTDVDGIYDRPPADSAAALLHEIVIENDGSVKNKITTRTCGCDVTGGIQKKLDSAIAVVTGTNGRTVVFVCGIDTPVAQRVCLSGVSESHGQGSLIRLAEVS